MTPKGTKMTSNELKRIQETSSPLPKSVKFVLNAESVDEKNNLKGCSLMEIDVECLDKTIRTKNSNSILV